MKILKLSNINKTFFGYEEIARVLGITNASARVSANRYVKQGVLIRLKRGLYVLRERWNYFNRDERFNIANILQVPSYVSLMSALDYHEITTQMQRGFVESIVLKRTKVINIDKNVFNYTRINIDLYFGFKKVGEFFIASPEKAFLDAIYLMSLGRYNFDLTSIDVRKLNTDEIKKIVKRFPAKTKKFLVKYGYFPET